MEKTLVGGCGGENEEVILGKELDFLGREQVSNIRRDSFVEPLGSILLQNLSHRSFDLPKWLEYLFAYGGVLAFQCGGEENVDDLVRQPFYRFLQRTVLLHMMAYSFLFYFCGGMPLLVWGIGITIAVRLHLTFLVNSVCHIWGTRAWNTSDFSKNNWWVAILTLGEGWHNNHHAFEFSARHGLEWWQLDITWCLIRFLEAIGLATNVKLPTETQMKGKALV
ncbi:unnamed protein product [Arabidopsis thaliana]|uniref:(thale cress) hypothetical protein n=1 Tax=Arabidopsis thaliana TaxID=3702 RepID=A0A7G2EPJ1_ARATH|nr:unnamed protein product [Arabidopsis thaliana]